MKASMVRAEWYLHLADVALRGTGKLTDFKLRNRRNSLLIIRKGLKARHDQLKRKSR